MPSSSRIPRYASKQLSERMKEAGERLALEFRSATALEHAGARGGKREESVRDFLADRLPGGYAVTTGFTFDAHDKLSKQLDVLIYRIRDTPFLLKGEPVLVPCESLLAAIEIKSELTTGEIRDGLAVAQSIRELKPFDKSFIDARQRGVPANDSPRCLFAILAFGTNLIGGEDWLIREGARFARIADEVAIPAQYVDRLLVMDRGIINCAEGRGHDSVRSGQTAIQIFFVHLINHLLREDRRRKEIDIDIYTGRDRWMSLPEWPTATTGVGDQLGDRSQARTSQPKRNTTSAARRGRGATAQGNGRRKRK